MPSKLTLADIDQNDPELPEHFRKKVPKSFYARETEEKLGPLPPQWEKAFYQDDKSSPYFVDHKEKKTTWIDPRTIHTRKKNLQDVVEGELPYGWDEALDVEIGVYYIDHTTQTTYLLPPWDDTVKRQARMLQDYLKSEVDNLNQRFPQLENEKLDMAAKRVNQLEVERMKLEKELLDLRKKAIEAEKEAALSREAQEITIDEDLIKSKAYEAVDEKMSREQAEARRREEALLGRLQNVEAQIGAQRQEQEELGISKEIQDFRDRLAELAELNKRLLNNEGVDEVSEAKETQAELDRVQAQLQEEADSRQRLEREIIELKGVMEQLFTGTVTPHQPIEDDTELIPAEDEATRRRKTRAEMLMELMMLKKRLQAEREEKDRLNRIKDAMQEARGDARPGEKLPDWIKKIEEVASNSRTLRVKIGRKQAENPDVLSFRERMLFYASGAIDSNIKANPPPPKKLNQLP